MPLKKGKSIKQIKSQLTASLRGGAKRRRSNLKMNKTNLLKASFILALSISIFFSTPAFAQIEQHDIYLHEGWTLIGLPVTPETSYTAESLGQEINSHGGSCNRVMRWDGSGWQTHMIGMPFGDFSIDEKEGYFILCDLPSTWSVQGEPIGCLSHTLHEGWALINAPFEDLTAESMGDDINFQGGSCNRIMHWDGSGWQTHIIGTPFGDFPIEKKKSYFVLCDSASGWVYSTSSIQPPSNLHATAGDSLVILTWDPNPGPDIAGYNVYRGGGRVYTKINSELVTTNSYNDDTVTNGSQYYYVVTAVDSCFIESSYSNQVSVIPQPSSGPTYVSGNITSDTTWTLAGSPYIITGDISVNGTADTPVTLAIEPGVEVRSDSDKGLRVGNTGKASLYAVGTEKSPIIFTSNNGTPSPGDWKGILIDTYAIDESTHLKYIRVSYGGVRNLRGHGANIDCYYASPATLQYITSSYSSGAGTAFFSSSPTISNLTVSNNATGIHIEGSSPTIENCTIEANTSYGINCNSSSHPTLTTNTFYNNGGYPLRMGCMSTLNNNTFRASRGNTIPAIEVNGGRISQSRTWPHQGQDYLVLGEIEVWHSSSPILTISPGTIVKFKSNTGLNIGENGSNELGALDAQGTDENQIIFTSSKDDSVGCDAEQDGATTPSPGDWKGILIDTYAIDESTHLKYIRVSYSGVKNHRGHGTNIDCYYASPATFQYITSSYSSSTGIAFFSSSPTISNLTVSNNATGIHIADSSPTIENCTISNNASHGIYCTSGSNPRIFYSNIFNNGGYNLNNATTATINAVLIWWGDVGGPLSTINGQVVYEPWLGQPFTEPFKITDVRISTNKFNQNGGSCTFYVILFENATWTIKILDESQRAVKTFNGQGQTISQDWDGTNEDGALLPNGIYTYKVEATSNMTAQPAAPAIGKIELDDTIPIAKITSPLQGQVLTSGVVTITGTAASSDFKSYQLQYGVGESPASWTGIHTSNSPVVEDVFATWDTSNLTNPTYALKLTVTDNQSRQATVQVVVRILNIYGISDDPDPFSPNGDSIKDTTTINATMTMPIDWTVTIKDSSEVTVKTFSSSGDTISQVWDGTDESGVIIVPDDTYTYYIDGTEPISGLSIPQASGTVTVDNTFPVAEITSPADDEDIFGNVDITGTAQDNNLSSYVVEYGVGTSPSEWITINTGSSNVIDGVLATWNTIPITNGTYTIRLRATDIVDNESSDSVVVNVDNILITDVSTSPQFIDPFLGETAILYYTLNRAANVTIDLHRAYVVIGDHGDGTYYREFVMNLVSGDGAFEGENTYEWDGRDGGGDIVEHSAYVYVITAEDAFGRVGTFDPPYVYGEASVTDCSVTPIDYDPYRNEPIYINYTLSAPAWVTIGGEYPANFPKFLLEGAPRDEGPNTEVWDGRDGLGNIVQEDFTVSIKTEILPCVFTVIGDTTLKIDELQTEAYRIIPTYNQISTIYYSITRDADITVRIFDPNGSSWIIADFPGQTAGSHSVEWDGTDDQGLMVNVEGNYRVELTASDGTTNILRSANITVYK